MHDVTGAPSNVSEAARRASSALIRAIGKPDRSNAKRSEKNSGHDSAGEPELKPLWRLCQGDGYWA
jgi:hypothetical protein